MVGGCTLTQPGDQIDGSKGTRPAFFEKYYVARQEIDTKQYPCFAAVKDDDFISGRVVQVHYWSGKSSVHVPALTEDAFDFNQGDRVQLLLKPCEKGEYSRVTRKIQAH
jgi:hypothetical protein